jgi:hypothetical protein
MSSLMSAGFTPLSRVRPTCAAICAVFPVETVAKTVTRLRSRGASSFRNVALKIVLIYFSDSVYYV